MSIASRISSSLLRLLALAVLVVVFFLSMAGVVYMSLQGSEIKVPELSGKSFNETEKELAQLGLKVKKRAERISPETPDSVIEQLPKAGETVKTGQVIYVVTSKGGGTQTDVPPTVKTDEDDSDKIEEMITDKPKKAKINSNTANRKKADTMRDVTGKDANTSTGDTQTGTTGDNNKKEGDKSGSQPASNKTTPNSNDKETHTKPSTDTKPKMSGDNKPKTPAKPNKQ